ncbi:hypothetical protein G3N95_23355 [Paraburkholderia sp. Tr-20389]|uniref:hypothetical protein n=1 Tax=Paraburkholderia sp. Tr-20389 TaxID=2703903 RepID=UPI0019809FEA|nr:hypothetical protein [Paraburkholderia sp. Tr-20389]MBN3755902.1 hypothetical protein [Paraburkholderia sp. Tr-20389]
MTFADQYYLDASGGLHFLSQQDHANAIAQGLSIPEDSWTIATPEQVEALQNPPLTTKQKAEQILAGGLTVTSAGTPALNGTFPVDALSQSDIIAIETSLNAGKGFPGGATTFSYPDATGAMRAFSESNFTDFAAAVRDFVYGCRGVIAGASTVLPVASVAIP